MRCFYQKTIVRHWSLGHGFLKTNSALFRWGFLSPSSESRAGMFSSVRSIIHMASLWSRWSVLPHLNDHLTLTNWPAIQENIVRLCLPDKARQNYPVRPDQCNSRTKTVGKLSLLLPQVFKLMRPALSSFVWIYIHDIS